MEQQKKTCKECGKTKPINKFWHRKNGTLFDVCKECAWRYVDNKKPNTFLWILKEADVPFIEERWVDLCRKKYNKDPHHFGCSSVIGTYLRVMYTRGFTDYSYSDTLELNKNLIEDRKRAAESKANATERAKQFEEEVNEVSFSSDLFKNAVPDMAPNEEY